ncbi:MAG: CHASE domain-containing protein, partial [Rhizobacter sp.]|nr:CHASE domain-containing protein [Rhizobacter sp.]
MSDQVATRMRIYEDGLRATRGAFVAAGEESLERRHFRDFSVTLDIDREYPGARGFGIIRRVPAGDEASFVAGARADGWPDFGIRQLEPHAGDRYVIQHIEPVERNAAAVGLDVASEGRRRQAAQISMRSGEATLTGVITLVQATGQPLRAFLLMLPIYRPGADIASGAAREAAVIGWSYAPLIIDEVLQGMDWADGQFTIALRDAADTDAKDFFVSPGGGMPAAAGLSREVVFKIYGRAWVADVRATP